MSTFRNADGFTISYRQWDGDVARPPVVLQHGFASSGENNWVRTGIVDALTHAGRRVVTVDALGHGDSDKPHDPAFYGEVRMSRDLSHLIDVIEAESFDLVGYSMGAVISLITATRDPRVRRLAVGGVGAGIVELGGLDSRAAAPTAIRDALLADDVDEITDLTARGFRIFAEQNGNDPRALAAQASAINEGHIDLASITAPTLVFAGIEDPLAVRPEVLAAAIPHATLTTVAGDHLGAFRDPALRAAIVSHIDQ